MKEEQISFETAKLAKQKGFVGPMGWGYSADGKLDLYRGHAPIPSSNQEYLHKWLRDNYQLCIRVNPPYDSDIWCGSVFKIGQYSCLLNIEDQSCYEDVMEQGLREALKLIIMPG